MKEFTPEYLERIAAIIRDNDVDAARAELAGMHPADIAELYQNLELSEAEYLYRLLDQEQAADVMMELDEDDRLKLLSDMPAEEIAKQIDYLDTDDAVDLIQQLDEDEREEILSHIDDVEQAGDIIDLLKYDEDTAGGLMGTEMIVVNENWSMPECIKQMRMQAEEMDEIYYVYVVDNDYKLRGVFPLKKMVTHPSVSKIKHVMEADPVSVKADTPIDEVALDFEKYARSKRTRLSACIRSVVRRRRRRLHIRTSQSPYSLAPDRNRIWNPRLPDSRKLREPAPCRYGTRPVHPHHWRYRR